ncbi:tetraspanin Pls1 family [Punctularia strigosozonata HHB-11173 SS5]|uniref:tetraspanin Pls1 family n=1 Tax=Punctularia strigosozonata (strain HHB-11173) TaxID=741275 RepID=UPI000441727B|nr:tetraspanin Pls1 family [Punctularia strigosozonata HHB-11173 SS5]EIN07704.1 tetraspanin Pls1 family [Punctularia strigosozonata HHB-11173 SS5]
MPSKQLMGAFAFLDFCLLVAGVISIVFSIVWGQSNLMLNLVFSKADLTAGLVLGSFLLFTFVFSVGAIIQKNHVTIGLVILNWILIGDAIVVGVIGSFIWFFTLRERANFHKIFSEQPDATKIKIQDHLKCCGYFNSTDLAVVGGNFCANETFVTVTNNATGNFCVGPITAFADVSLNNTFSTIYGFMAIVIGLFLASLCVIKKRDEEERFKRIDAKRGGRGFV